VEARYVGQSYELPIAFRHRDADGWTRIAADFHAAHRDRFRHADVDAPIEIVGFGATAVGKVDTPQLPTLRSGGATPPADALLARRDLFFEGGGMSEAGSWVVARIYAREELLAHNLIEGPAVVEEVSATTVLYPGDRARVHASGALIVECRP
jgi:N-methylhydantoinase A